MLRCCHLVQSCLTVGTKQLEVIPEEQLCHRYRWSKSLGSAVFLTRLSAKTMCLKWIQLSNLMCLSSNPMQKKVPSREKAYLILLKIMQPYLSALLGTERTCLAYTFFLIFFLNLISLAFFPPSHLLSLLSPWNWFLLVCLGSNKISERITFQWHTFNRRQIICPNLIIKSLQCIFKGKQPLL